jgi:AraC-like DNA-binding protein
LHHKEEHQLEFYAQKMNLSVKTLSKKVKDKMHTSLGKLIRHEIITTSKALLLDDISIQDVSLSTGFEEVSHFSNFFTHQTGISPSQFKLQKVQ